MDAPISRTCARGAAWAIVLLVAAGCNGGDRDFVEVTGQIEAVSVGVGSRVGGRVIEVLVKEGDSVKTGDVLVRLEANEAQAALAAAEARLTQAEALLLKAENGARPEQLRQAEAAAARAEEQYRMAVKGARSQEIEASIAAAESARAMRDAARANLVRVEKLLENKAAPEQQYDNLKHAFDAADAQYRAAREKQDLVTEGARSEEINMAKAAFDQAAAMLDEIRNGARQEDLDAARALRDAAAADVQRARIGIEETTILASQNGVVESIDIHPGDLVKPGAVVSIVDPEALELYVYVSAIMLGRLRIGEKVVLVADAYGDDLFEGKVVFIAPEGEFTPRNLQTKEERVQQVFGVKLELDSAGGRLRAGMTVAARLPRNGPAA